MDSHDFQVTLTAWIVNLADWRRTRYEDDLRDDRNLQSADGLRRLARHIETLPQDDPRIVRLRQLMLASGAFQPSQQTAYEAGRFRFHDPASEVDTFLDFLVEVAERDQSEAGRFGGQQVQGDDPWE